MTKKEAEKKGFPIYEYSKNRWKYQDGILEHLMHDGKKVASGKYVHSYSKNSWMYAEEDKVSYFILKRMGLKSGD